MGEGRVCRQLALLHHTCYNSSSLYLYNLASGMNLDEPSQWYDAQWVFFLAAKIQASLPQADVTWPSSLAPTWSAWAGVHGAYNLHVNTAPPCSPLRTSLRIVISANIHPTVLCLANLHCISARLGHHLLMGVFLNQDGVGTLCHAAITPVTVCPLPYAMEGISV